MIIIAASCTAAARRSAIDFGLTNRALRFARLYAANPQWGPTACATHAGYSNRGRAAHVRGSELLRDPRVTRAIVYFGNLALAEAQALATKRLRLLADDPSTVSRRDRSMIENVASAIARLSDRVHHYEAALLCGGTAVLC